MSEFLQQRAVIPPGVEDIYFVVEESSGFTVKWVSITFNGIAPCGTVFRFSGPMGALLYVVEAKMCFTTPEQAAAHAMSLARSRLAEQTKKHQKNMEVLEEVREKGANEPWR
jgi:hypothetical protein